MNNEEKILSILEQMQGKFDLLENGQAEIKEDLGQIQGRLDLLENGQTEIKEDLEQMQGRLDLLEKGQAEIKEDVAFNRSTLARMEIELGQKLQIIIDSQVGYEEKHRQHEPRIVKLETDVTRLDYIVGALKAAK